MGAAGWGADRRAAVSRAGPAGAPGGVGRGAGGALRRDHLRSARTATPGQDRFPGSPSSRPSPPRPGEGSGGAARLTVTGFSPKRKVAPGEGNEDKRGLPACSRKGGVSSCPREGRGRNASLRIRSPLVAPTEFHGRRACRSLTPLPGGAGLQRASPGVQVTCQVLRG